MTHDVPLIRFAKGQSKDDVMAAHLAGFTGREDIAFIGVAQEKAQTFSGHKEGSTFRYDRDKTVYVNHYYFYIDDEDARSF